MGSQKRTVENDTRCQNTTQAASEKECTLNVHNDVRCPGGATRPGISFLTIMTCLCDSSHVSRPGVGVGEGARRMGREEGGEIEAEEKRKKGMLREGEEEEAASEGRGR